MRIRYRVLLILGVIMTLLIGSLYLVAHRVTFGSIAATENIYSISNAERFMANLNESISVMNNTVKDWAMWDDTYLFIEDHNTAFIESNLMENTFLNLELNLMVFFDQSGQVVYGEMFELVNQAQMSANQGILEDLVIYHTPNSDSIQSYSGLILLDGLPMIVGAHSILTSAQEGPPHGILVIGRYLDNEIESLSQSIGLPVSTALLYNSEVDSDFQIAVQHLSSQNPTFAQPLNETIMAGYVLLDDVVGNSIVITRVDDERIQYAQGKIALTWVLAALVSIIAIIFLVTAILLDKVVVLRLTNLNDAVINIRKTGDNSKRVKVQGQDELSKLGENINGMLDVIDKHTVSLENTVNERTKDLYKNQEKIKSILLASPDAIVATDLNGNITECNDQFAKLYGIDRQQLLGKSFLSFIYNNAPLELFESKTSPLKDSDEIVRFETTLIKGDGSQYPAELSINIISDEHGLPIGYVGIARDLSEQKLLEQRLFKAKRLAAIGELAGMIGHDLRNPLTAIKNAVYILKKKCSGCKEEHAQQMLDVIDKSIDHSNRIINNLVEYSREIYLELTDCSSKLLLQQALLNVKIPNNVTLIDHTSDKAFKADIDKVVRIFTNLIVNAFDAMPNGGTLEVADNKENDKIIITLSDNGVGIQKEELAKLFTPLFTTKAQGMGFGLSISKRIIEAHGGTISVESIVGQGTIFTLVFPVEPNITFGG